MKYRSMVAVYSYHHRKTEKVARVFAETLGARLVSLGEAEPAEFAGYGLLGFGSGIFSSARHPTLLQLAESLPPAKDARAFIFSTSGAPAFAFGGGGMEDYIGKAHAALRNTLQAKGYRIAAEFCYPGYNTNSFLWLFGGINRGRPDAADLQRARNCVVRMLEELPAGSGSQQ